MATAAYSGDTDGFVDATNRNPCDPRERFIKWHPQLAESEWPAYRDAYHAAYKRVCDRLLAAAREKRGAA